MPKANRYVRTLSNAYNTGKRLYPYFNAAYRSFQHHFRRPVSTTKKPVQTRRPTKSKPKPPSYQAITKRYRRYNTTATSLKKIPRRKKYRDPLSPFYYNGVVYRDEIGGESTVAGIGALYIGHSTCVAQKLFLNVWKALVRELLEKHGVQVSSMNEPLKMDTKDIYYSWFQSDDSITANQSSIVTGAFPTVTAIAGQLYTDMISQWSTAAPHVLQDLWITGTAGTPVYASISLQNRSVSINIASTLIVQNRTLGEAGVGTGEEYSRENIENNPLRVVSYQTNGNLFRPKWRASGDVSYVPFRSNADGMILTNSTDSIPEVLKEPVSPNFWAGKTTSSKFTIMPGAIRKNTITTKRSITLQSLLTIFYQESLVTAVVSNKSFGVSCMFGMEKVLDSRAGESSISVAYELNQTICVMVKPKRKQYCAQQVNIV